MLVLVPFQMDTSAESGRFQSSGEDIPFQVDRNGEFRHYQSSSEDFICTDCNFRTQNDSTAITHRQRFDHEVNRGVSLSEHDNSNKLLHLLSYHEGAAQPDM